MPVTRLTVVVARQTRAPVVRARGRLREEVALRCLVKHATGRGGDGTGTGRSDRRRTRIQRRLIRCVVMVTHYVDLTNASDHRQPEYKLHHHHHHINIDINALPNTSKELCTRRVRVIIIQMANKLTKSHVTTR